MSSTLSITTYGNYLAFITEVSKFLVDTMGFTLDTDLAAEYDRAVSQNDYITAFWTLDDHNTKLKIVSSIKTSALGGNGVLFYYVIGERTIQINNVTETTLEYCTPQVTTTRTMNVVYHMSENSYAMQFVPYNKSAPNRNTNVNMFFINYVIAKLSGVYCCAKGPQNTSLEIYDENGSVQSLATLFDYSAQNNGHSRHHSWSERRQHQYLCQLVLACENQMEYHPRDLSNQVELRCHRLGHNSLH